jgi:hypothetical protein
MKFDHAEKGMNCVVEFRALLTTWAAGEPISRENTAWMSWYLEHHCRHCGSCDDIETLPSEQDGLCIYCWREENAHPGWKQTSITPVHDTAE